MSDDAPVIQKSVLHARELADLDLVSRDVRQRVGAKPGLVGQGPDDYLESLHESLTRLNAEGTENG